jgi:hypothetical protein
VTTFAAQKASLAAVAPTYNVCTTADKFPAAPGAKYLLHYKNGATPTGILKVTDTTSVVPAGSTATAGFADLQVTTSMLATTESIVEIDNASRFLDGQGFVNLVNVTPTTLSVAIIGPL